MGRGTASDSDLFLTVMCLIIGARRPSHEEPSRDETHSLSKRTSY
jgi:hypothetical protein